MEFSSGVLKCTFHLTLLKLYMKILHDLFSFWNKELDEKAIDHTFFSRIYAVNNTIILKFRYCAFAFTDGSSISTSTIFLQFNIAPEFARKKLYANCFAGSSCTDVDNDIDIMMNHLLLNSSKVELRNCSDYRESLSISRPRSYLHI